MAQQHTHTLSGMVPPHPRSTHTHTNHTHKHTHTFSPSLFFSLSFSPSLSYPLACLLSLFPLCHTLSLTHTNTQSHIHTTHTDSCLILRPCSPLNEMIMFFWSLVTSAFFFLVSSEHFFPLLVSENLFYVFFPMFHQIFSRFGCISEENGVRYLSFRYLPLHINICKFI